MRSRDAVRATVACALAGLVTAMLGGAPAASAPHRATAGAACGLLSPKQLHSTLGFSQSTVLQDRAPTNAAGDVETECGWGVWTGAPPTSTSAMFAFLRAGHAAQVGIETWAPNDASPSVKDWKNTDYDTLTGKFDTESVTFPGIFS